MVNLIIIAEGVGLIIAVIVALIGKNKLKTFIVTEISINLVILLVIISIYCIVKKPTGWDAYKDNDLPDTNSLTLNSLMEEAENFVTTNNERYLY